MRILLLACLMLCVGMVGCGGGGGGGPVINPTPITVAVSPNPVTVTAGQAQAFIANVVGTANSAVTWSVQEGAAGGSITTGGIYTAPAATGTYHVVAASQDNASAAGTATITVVAPAQTGGVAGTIQ